jgi:hypothetical protein
MVAGDGRPLAEEGMVVGGEGFGVIELEELGPLADFVFFAGVVRVAFEGEWLFEVGELLVVKPAASRSGPGRAASGRRSSRW